MKNTKKIKIADKKNLILAIILFVVVIVFSLIVRFQAFSENTSCGVDGYYHVTMSQNFFSLCMTREFAKTQLSVWKENFYDKELGFHALLAGIQLFTGNADHAPYHELSILLIILLISLMLLAVHYSNISTYYVIPPLLMAISPLFFLRINMIRPHILSILFFWLIICLLISKLKNKQKYISLFVLGVAYAYSYSSPHLILIPLLCYALASAIYHKQKTEIKNLSFFIVCAVGGVLAGLIIHPQFPNTLYLWYVQGVLVSRQIMGEDFGVGLGLELLSPKGHVYIENIGLYFLALLNVILYFRFCDKNKNIIFLLTTQLIMLLGFSFSERCIEYTLPAGVLCFALITSHLIQKYFQKSTWKLHLYLATITLFIYLGTLPFQLKSLKEASFPAYSNFSKWAKINLPKDTYIGHIRWGEFPMLLQAAPHCTFSMALDPMFTYALYPEKIRKLEDFRHLKKSLSLKEIYEILGTNLVFVSKYDPVCDKHIKFSNARILYKDSMCTLFLIPPELLGMNNFK